MIRNSHCSQSKQKTFELDQLFVDTLNAGLSGHAITQHKVFISSDNPKLAQEISSLLNKLKLVSANVNKRRKS